MRGFKSGLRSGIATNDSALRRSNLLTPAFLYSLGKLIGWYTTKEVSSLILENNKLIQWNSLVVNQNFAAPSEATRPSVGVANDRLSIIFDGIDDMMLQSKVNPFKIAIFATFGYPNNNSAPPFVWSGNNTNASNRLFELHLQQGGSIRVLQNEAGPFADTPRETAQSLYTNCILGGAYGPSSDPQIRAHINGISVFTNSTPNNSIQVPLRIGQRGDGTFQSQGQYSDLIIWQDWNLKEIEIIEGILAWQYGGSLLNQLNPFHPFKWRAPVTSDLVEHL